jgi:hypothetical protein
MVVTQPRYAPSGQSFLACLFNSANMPLSKLTRKVLTENTTLKSDLLYRPSCWVHDVNLSRGTHGEFNVLYNCGIMGKSLLSIYESLQKRSIFR